MTVFVPGPLRNPLNGQRDIWQKHRRWAKQWRERTAERLRLALLTPRRLEVDPRTPKRITFTAHVASLWDDDNLPAGLKSIRDGLRDGGIIHDDGPASGHTFVYAQVRDRANRGVEIEWTVAPSSPASSP